MKTNDIGWLLAVLLFPLFLSFNATAQWCTYLGQCTEQEQRAQVNGILHQGFAQPDTAYSGPTSGGVWLDGVPQPSVSATGGTLQQWESDWNKPRDHWFETTPYGGTSQTQSDGVCLFGKADGIFCK